MKMKNVLHILSITINRYAIVWLMVLLLQACTKDTAPKTTGLKNQDFGRLTYVVGDNYSFTLFYAGLMATGYGDTLANSAGPYTLFVPNNDAMKASHFYGISNNDTVNYFLRVSNPSTAEYVRYLILPRKVVLSDLPVGDNQVFITLAGTPIYISKYKSGTDTVITVNGVKVISKDIVTSNGLINVISEVPQPQVFKTLWQQIQANSTLVYFATAIQRAGLQTFFDTANHITVLAPSNGSFGIYKDFPDMSSPDKIQAADTASLRKMIYCSVLKGTYFVGDFDRNTDTASYTTYKGAIIKYVPPSIAAYNSPYFETNAQEWFSYNNSYSQVQPVWAAGGKHGGFVGWPTPYSNVPSGNGVCQEIDRGVLLP